MEHVRTCKYNAYLFIVVIIWNAMHLFNIVYVVLCIQYNTFILVVFRLLKIQWWQTHNTCWLIRKKAHARTSKYIAYYFGTSINGLGSSWAWIYTSHAQHSSRLHVTWFEFQRKSVFSPFSKYVKLTKCAYNNTVSYVL